MKWRNICVEKSKLVAMFVCLAAGLADNMYCSKLLLRTFEGWVARFERVLEIAKFQELFAERGLLAVKRSKSTYIIILDGSDFDHAVHKFQKILFCFGGNGFLGSKT